MGMSVCVPNLKIVRADGGRGGRQLRNTEHIYINNRAVKKYIIHRVFYLTVPSFTVSLRLSFLLLESFYRYGKSLRRPCDYITDYP